MRHDTGGELALQYRGSRRRLPIPPPACSSVLSGKAHLTGAGVCIVSAPACDNAMTCTGCRRDGGIHIRKGEVILGGNYIWTARYGENVHSQPRKSSTGELFSREYSLLTLCRVSRDQWDNLPWSVASQLGLYDTLTFSLGGPMYVLRLLVTSALS